MQRRLKSTFSIRNRLDCRLEGFIVFSFFIRRITDLSSRLSDEQRTITIRSRITPWRNFCQRRFSALSYTLALLPVLLVSSWPVTTHAAIDPQYQCTSEPDPNSMSSPTGAKCQPVDIGPWRFLAGDLGYGLNNGYWNTTYFNSESALTSAIGANFLAASNSCTVDYSGSTLYSSGPSGGYIYSAGILIITYWTANYDTTWPTPGCGINGTYTPEYSQRRNLSCPEGYTFTHDAATSTGPYCACPWGSSDACAVKMCFQGAVSKGNPCNVTTGNKFEVEPDYKSPNGVLQFQRYYNSKLAYDNYRSSSSSSPSQPAPWFPLGTGWSGTYFQRVSYTDIPNYSGLIAFRPDSSELAFNEDSGGNFTFGGENDARVERVLNGSSVQIGWNLITGSDDVEFYDMGGRLQTITSRNGVVQTLQYSGSYLSSVTDSFGNTLTFTWNADARLQSITLPDSGQISYTYDSSTYNLLDVTYPDTASRIYHYELTGVKANLLTGITDEAGVRFATWGYATSGTLWRAVSSTHADGANSYTFSYSGATSRTVVDPTGTSRTYTLQKVNGHPRLKTAPSTCAGCTEPKENVYDAKGNITSSTDFNNVETRLTYDTARTLETSRTEAYGTANARTISTTWHSTFRLPTQIDELSRTTTFTYDSDGNVLTRTITDTGVTPNVSRTSTYTYDSYGRVLTEDGPRTDVSDVTTYSYYSCTTGDECGQLNTVTNALSQITTYSTYNAHGQPLTITDPNGVVTTLTYDARQRLTSRTVGSEATTLEYWPTGLLKKTTLPDGSYVLNTYDGAHRLIQVEDGAGNRIEYTLDAMGNRTVEDVFDPSSALARTHTQVFNALNQLWKQIGAAGTSAVTTEY